MPRAIALAHAVEIPKSGVDDVHSRRMRHAACFRWLRRSGNPEVREKFALGFSRRPDHARAPLIDVPQLIPYLQHAAGKKLIVRVLTK